MITVTGEETPRVHVVCECRGVLTISGGTLEQTPTSIGSLWLFNGVSGDDGIGRFMVIGPNPVVTAKRYDQNFHSRWAFMLEEESPHISPIV